MQLSAYLTAAMISWIPNADVTWYESVANDVATVVLSEEEPELFIDDLNRTKTGLLMISIARFESNFIRRIDEGKCYANECDNGNAFSMWQIHPIHGIVLTPTSYMYYTREVSHDENIIRGIDLVKNRQLACKTAMHFARVSLAKYKSLCMYTGESCKTGRHPMADVRLSTALSYEKTHPLQSLPVDVSLR